MATFWPYNYEPAGPRGVNSFNKERAQQHARLEDGHLARTNRSEFTFTRSP